MEAVPHVSIPYLTILGPAAVVGSLGNVAVLSAILLNHNLHKPQSVFLVSLAIADIIVTNVMDPLSVIGECMVEGRGFFESRPVLCDIAAVICVVACVAALLNIGAISFTQYIFICHPHQAKTICSTRNCALMALFFWVVGTAVALPTLLGWSNNVYDHKMLECIWDRTHSFSYTVFYTSVAVFGPLVLISFSYVRIYRHVTLVKKRIGQQQQADAPGKNMSQPSKDKLRNDAIRLAKTLFIIFIVFAVCWMPYSVLVLIDYDDRFPHEVHLYALLLAHLHATADPIVYGITNKHFQDGYRKLLYVLTCKKFASLGPRAVPSSVAMENSARFTR
ncbi:hypothetical protein CAPTEDRAFT_137001 [Capitella teleta]|uniref:G-protein coupled receptors family 1 profile domain-containing protein n=1 Tax=Capitella teleta TaxID=283909 RepID=R7UZD5_CAPTE|nr:hypothetical protein CAPTEDRAFT_137001 [Capitella teleta]|eukprot:ELU11617.1 hypothetical protein CAPTEDRAFT_137001 [Capitella teleta]